MHSVVHYCSASLSLFHRARFLSVFVWQKTEIAHAANFSSPSLPPSLSWRPAEIDTDRSGKACHASLSVSLSLSLPFEQPSPLSRLLELIAKLEPFTPNSQLLASLSLSSAEEIMTFLAPIGISSAFSRSPSVRSQLGGIILVTTLVSGLSFIL